MIENCLEKSGFDHVSFNLVKRPEVIDALSSCLERNIGNFVSRISLLAGRKLEKGKTIIFLDEIQECREILTAVKFLVEDGTYRYVLSGSLLGVELSGVKSAPVGYLQTLRMYPMDYHEFLKALNVQDSLIENLGRCFEERRPVDEVVHDKLMEMFYLYLVVGGMPEAVQNFVENGDFMGVGAIHESIIEQYKVDFTKYEKKNKLKLIRAYDLIPSELNSKNKRFIFTDLDKNLRFDEYEDSFLWFSNAGVAIPVYNTTEPVVPLAINRKSNLFKLFLSDVGLLSTLYGNTTRLKLLDRGEDINCGAVFENVVSQELLAKGFRLFYYNSKKLGEIDFVIECGGSVLPIEVKSGKDYYRHSALNNVLGVEEYGIDEAFVFANTNIEVEGKITFYQIYMLMCLPYEVALPHVEPFDFSKMLL